MEELRIVLSEEAKNSYETFCNDCKYNNIMIKAITNKFGLIKNNPHYGNPIAKNIIPKKYYKNYGITNLFRVELPNYWRMLYTLASNETEIIIFVLGIMNHKEYNKLFGY